MFADRQRVALEEVHRAGDVGMVGGRHGPRRAGIETQGPDGNLGVVSCSPRVRRRRSRLGVVECAGNDRDAATLEGDNGDLVCPQHGEVRLDHLVGGGQVEPDLEQLGGVRRGRLDQREHLAVHDACTGGQPLRVATSEAGSSTQRIGMVDQPPTDQGDGLEAAVRVLREARHLVAVVHAPAVARLEVGPDLAAGQ